MTIAVFLLKPNLWLMNFAPFVENWEKKPRFNASFQAWVTAVAKRYAGVITMYEFWNEQNGCSWINDGCANGNMAASYAPWLCTWAAAMRKSDPGARLSIGGLDYNAGVMKGYTYACSEQQFLTWVFWRPGLGHVYIFLGPEICRTDADILKIYMKLELGIVSTL